MPNLIVWLTGGDDSVALVCQNAPSEAKVDSLLPRPKYDEPGRSKVGNMYAFVDVEDANVVLAEFDRMGVGYTLSEQDLMAVEPSHLGV
jgi:hypothetical protein